MKFTPGRMALLRKEFDQISSWDEWEVFSEKFFDWENMPERRIGQVEKDLQRQTVKKDGLEWEPFAGVYNVDPEIEVLFENLSNRIFERLEPEAYKKNTENTEQFGWKCVACRVYTRRKTKICSFCGQQLLPMPLNE